MVREFNTQCWMLLVSNAKPLSLWLGVHHQMFHSLNFVICKVEKS